jgi:MFS family permease
MIRSFGVKKDDVARWAGFTGAIFSIAQSMTAVPWGRASDRIGRKPVILFGLLSTMICFVIWGLSTSLTMAITVRAVMGGGNGNGQSDLHVVWLRPPQPADPVKVGIIRTMVAEMVPEKELQPKAFSIMPLVWSIGSVFGPAFGGFFARPAEQYPGLFGNSEFFNKYPFALPNLMACLVFFISWLTGLLFLKVSCRDGISRMAQHG